MPCYVSIKEADVLRFCSDQLVKICREIHQEAFAANALDLTRANRGAAFSRVAMCCIKCVLKLKEFTDKGVGQHPVLNKAYVDFLARNMYKQANFTLPKEISVLPRKTKALEEKLLTTKAKAESAVAKGGFGNYKTQVESRFSSLIQKNNLKK